jgi:hypothetical protein
MQQLARVLFLTVVTLAAFFGMTTHSIAGARDHQGGFFLRLSAGGGVASTSVEDSGDEIKLSGPAGDLNIAIGAMVGSNLAVHGTLFGWAVSDPDAEINDIEGELNGDLGMSAIGVGLTYYMMPANVYLSGSVGLGALSFDAGDADIESDNGMAVDLTVGKEWWVGNNWGLGVAGSLGFHSIPDGDIDENWSGTNFAVRFTATMN